MNIGADYLGQEVCEFVVWAPLLENVSLKLVFPSERIIPMKKDDN
jgi:maltooligosyltrehalose trehalohydrolase